MINHESISQEEFDIFHVGHATFAFRYRNSHILIDPFFADEFEWKGIMEQRLTKAVGSVEDFFPCGAALVTHDHGDHCDWKAIKALVDQGAGLYAPGKVIESAPFGILPENGVHAVSPQDQFTVNGMNILVLQDTSNPPNEVQRAAFFLVIEGFGILFGGDSHGPGADWNELDGAVDLALFWPHPKAFGELVESVHPKRIFLMHGDRFAPGDFLCNTDLEAFGEPFRRLFPMTQIQVPPRGRWIPIL